MKGYRKHSYSYYTCTLRDYSSEVMDVISSFTSLTKLPCSKTFTNYDLKVVVHLADLTQWIHEGFFRFVGQTTPVLTVTELCFHEKTAPRSCENEHIRNTLFL